MNEIENKLILRQVEKRHYYMSEYLNKDRFIGLQAQISFTVSQKNVSNILEVGPGPGLYSSIMREFGYRVTTVDFAKDLKPDVYGRLPYLPFEDGSFDAVCAFEVLEHLPFEYFESCINEFKRISDNLILLSLPDQDAINEGEISFEINIGTKRYRKTFWKRKLNRLTNPTEHYWEIGHDGICIKNILDICKKHGFAKVDDSLIEPYFHFFILRIK